MGRSTAAKVPTLHNTAAKTEVLQSRKGDKRDVHEGKERCLYLQTSSTVGDTADSYERQQLPMVILKLPAHPSTATISV